MQDLDWEDPWRDADIDAEALGSSLAGLLQPKPALAREELLRAVAAFPLRYAPFFSRIAELWDLPVGDVEAVMQRAREPSNWRKPGLPGLTLIDVEGGERVRGAQVNLVRFAAGMRFPAHSHPGPETLLILEGSYRDSEGVHVGPGDIHSMLPGSEHSFRVGREGPCVAASVQYGRRFTGLVMRALIRLFG
ncbi:MAG TPA: cupin domain-containing protein [Polyangiaceae bacterium]|nr:cupin domain-containing protein [Polyangiaceae bacterium]